MAKQATLCYLTKSIDNTLQVLLGKKLRGDKIGFYNGFGGKVGDKVSNETVEEALIREGEEEFGITVIVPEKRGEITYSFFLPNAEVPFVLLVHVFTATDFSGELKESDEMSPEWFTFENIPWNKMEGNDKLWLPDLLTKKLYLEANFDFDKAGNQLNTSKIEWK